MPRLVATALLTAIGLLLPPAIASAIPPFPQPRMVFQPADFPSVIQRGPAQVVAHFIIDEEFAGDWMMYGFSFTDIGTASWGAVEDAWLIHDRNASGAYETDEDAVVTGFQGSVSGPPFRRVWFAGFEQSGIWSPGGGPQHMLILYDLGPAASPAGEYQVRITEADVQAVRGLGGTVSLDGLPLEPHPVVMNEVFVAARGDLVTDRTIGPGSSESIAAWTIEAWLPHELAAMAVEPAAGNPADVDRVTLWLDDGDDAFDPTGDTELASSVGLDHGLAPLVLEQPIALVPDEPRLVWLVADFSGSARDAMTYRVALTGVELATPGSVGGLPVESAALTVVRTPEPAVLASVSHTVADSLLSLMAGASDATVAVLELRAIDADPRLTAVSLRAAGDLVDPRDIPSVVLAVDANANGELDAADMLLADRRFAADNGELRLPTGDLRLAAGGAVRLLVAISLADGLAEGHELTLSLARIELAGAPLQTELPLALATVIIANDSGAVAEFDPLADVQAIHAAGGCAAGDAPCWPLLALLLLVPPLLRRRWSRTPWPGHVVIP